MFVLRLKRLTGRRSTRLLAAASIVLGVSALSAGSALAGGPPGRFHIGFHGKHHGRTQTCAGTPEAPGTLTGFHFGDVSVEGVCAVNGGQAVVGGNVTVRPGSALIAAFALNDQTGTGSSSLTVLGDVRVGSEAAAVLGCDAEHFPCLDDPEPEAPTLSSQTRIFGDLQEYQPLGVVVHNSVVGGDISEVGGGGGLTCEPTGIFAAFESPAYSDYEDTSVFGGISVSGLSSCWMGVIRDHVRGDVRLVNNQLADPDAIEILSNKIGRNLVCLHNSQVWNSADETENLYPRAPEPNTVHGRRFGQCVLASPATEGGPLGPGLF